MPGEESATWAGNLRMKSSLAATRLLLRSEGSDRFRAAEALQHDMDRTASGLTQSLKLGERLSRTMRRPPEIMFVPTNKERSLASKMPHLASVLAAEEGELRSKEQMRNECRLPSPQGPTSRIPPPTQIPRPPADAARSNPLRSSHLWSKKSFDMYRRMQEFLDASRSLPAIDTMRLYTKGDPIGVVDTLYSSQNGEYLEQCCNIWVFHKSRFEISKTRYIQAEVEPLVMMLSGRPGLRRSYETIGGVGGTAAIAPLRAVLKAERKDGDKLATKHQANAGSRLHVRPLYTAGDLMLALFELMDPRLFSSGYVQMVGDLPLRDTASSWSQEVNLFRVTYRVGKPNKWFHIRPSAKFDFHNQDLSAFLCPHLCPNAFTMTQIAASMETVEMKVWVSNFVRSYKTVHGLGSLEPACRSGNGIPKPCESMVGLTLDVQFIRHVEDAYLYSSQVRQQSKAEMRLQELERLQIFEDEQDSLLAGDITTLLRGGKNYEIKIRLLHIIEVKLDKKTNIMDAAVGTSVSGFHTPRKASMATCFPDVAPQTPHSPDTYPAALPRNIIEEIPKFDVEFTENNGCESVSQIEITNVEGELVRAEYAEGNSGEGDENPLKNADSRDADSDSSARSSNQAKLKTELQPTKKKKESSVIRQMRNSIHGAPEIEAFLRRCREMSALYNKEGKKLRRFDTVSDDNRSQSSDKNESSQSSSDSSESEAEGGFDIDTLLLRSTRNGTAGSHYQRSKIRRNLLAKEKEIAVEEEQRRKDLMLLMEMDSMRKIRLASKTASQPKQKRRQSALFMYSDESEEPPVLFTENIRKQSTIINFGFASREFNVSNNLEDLREVGHPEENESDPERDIATPENLVEHLTPSQKVKSIMMQRKKKKATRIGGKKLSKRGSLVAKKIQNSLSSVGAGPPRLARNRAVSKSGQYSSSEDELTVNKSVLIIENPVVITIDNVPSLCAAGHSCEIADDNFIEQCDTPERSVADSTELTMVPAVPTSPPQLFKYDYRRDIALSAHDADAQEEIEQSRLLNGDKISEDENKVYDVKLSAMGDDFPCDRSALPLVVTVTNLNIGKSNHRKCSTERLDEGIENFEDLTHFIGDEWNCVWKNVEEIPEFDDFLQLALGHSSSRPSSLFQSEVDATYSGHIANEPAAEPKTVFVERTNFVPVSYPGKDGNGKEQDSLEWISHIPELAALFGTATRTIKVNHTEHKGSKNGDTTNTMDFGGIVSAQAAYPIVIGKKAIAGAFPHRNEIVSSIVTALDDGNPSYLIRSSSDSEFIAQRKVQKENFPAKSIGHAGDLVKMDSSQAFGNKNRIGYKCVKEKKCLCPLTVSCDQFSSAISSTSPTIIPVPPSRLMSGESTLRSRKSLINSQLRVAKQPSAEIINSQFQDAAVDNEIKPVIPYQSAYSNTASTIIHSGDPSVWGKSHIFENEAVSSVDTGNRINLDSPEPVELLNSQELDADDEWKKWRLLQYQIWENKAKSTFDIVEDNRHMHQEISESVRPHSTPVPTKKHLQCYTLESDASFDAQEIGTMSATPPNAPKSSHVYVRPHTSGAQFMRSTIVIPSPIPPDMSSNGARIHRGEWPFHIDGESGGAEIITIPEPIESDIEWDCNQLHEAELGILPKSLEDEIGMSNLKQLKKATKKRKVKSKRRSPFAKPKNYDTQPNERVAVAPMNVPQRNLSTAVRFVVKNSLHPNTSESHKTHTENCRSAAVAVHIGNEPPTNIVALNIGTSTGNNLRANTALKSHSYKSEAGIFTPPNPMPQRDDAVKVEVVESGKPEFMTDMISIDATNAVGSIAPLPFRPNSVRSVVQTPLTAKRVHRRMDTIERATAGNNGVAVPVLNLCL